MTVMLREASLAGVSRQAVGVSGVAGVAGVSGMAGVTGAGGAAGMAAVAAVPGTAALADSEGVAMTVNSVRLAPALEARLAEVAGRLRLSKSDVIRQALGEFLEKLEVVPPAAGQAG